MRDDLIANVNWTEGAHLDDATVDELKPAFGIERIGKTQEVVGRQPCVGCHAIMILGQPNLAH